MIPAQLELFADYYQIHVFDDGSTTDLGDAWTDDAVLDNLAVADDAMAVGTAVNVNVAVTPWRSFSATVTPGRDWLRTA